jgi:hypothetical protein
MYVYIMLDLASTDIEVSMQHHASATLYLWSEGFLHYVRGTSGLGFVTVVLRGHVDAPTAIWYVTVGQSTPCALIRWKWKFENNH